VIELRETGRALLMGLRRPTHSALKALAYPVWDMLWLTGSLALIMWELEEHKPGFWHNWFLELPIWVTPTFSLLALSHTYVTCWPRARLRDVLMVVFWLQGGLVLSLGLALLIDPASSSQSILRALLIAGITHPVMVSSRLVYRCIDELVIWLRRQGDPDSGADNTLLYGAGLRAQLFLKDYAVRCAKGCEQRMIVGFLDDEPSLHFQWVYGQLVLGGLKDLPYLVTRHKIERIVITGDLASENRAAVIEFALLNSIILSEWKPEEQFIASGSTQKPEPVEVSA
jgi:FlaA1/EpsC-like NDP-sugar epimerase